MPFKFLAYIFLLTSCQSYRGRGTHSSFPYYDDKESIIDGYMVRIDWLDYSFGEQVWTPKYPQHLKGKKWAYFRSKFDPKQYELLSVNLMYLHATNESIEAEKVASINDITGEVFGLLAVPKESNCFPVMIVRHLVDQKEMVEQYRIAGEPR